VVKNGDLKVAIIVVLRAKTAHYRIDFEAATANFTLCQRQEKSVCGRC
jgi:hypothetical protein